MDATIDVTQPGGPAARVDVLSTLVAALPMIRPELPSDGPLIEPVLDAAFGPGRFAKVSERVREFATLNRVLSFVATDDSGVIGCCRLYDIAIGATPALFLGPLAVHPRVQAAGLGQALVQAAVTRAGDDKPILLVGQPRLFARFGFEQVPEGRVIMPGPTEARRLQWLHARADVAGRVTSPVLITPVFTSPRAAN